MLRSEGGVRLEAHGVDADETVGIGRVVVKGVTTSLNVHGSQVGVVQGLRAGAAADDAVALVELEFDHTLHVALGKVNRVADQVHFRGEPESVVAEAGEFERHVFCDALDLPVHGHALQIHVGRAQQSAARGFVDAATLDADKAIFDNVDAANAVLSGNFVAVEKDFERIGLDGAVRDVGDLGRHSLDELNLDSLGCVRGGLWRFGHLEHGVVRAASRIFEHATFVGSVEQVLVNGVVGLGLGVDGDAVLGAVGQEVAAALEGLNELGITPRGDTLDGGAQGLAAHFEANLVVSLTGGSVRDESAAFLAGDADHLLGNAGTCNGGTKKVPSFVQAVTFDGLEDVVINKVLTEVRDDAFFGSDGDGLRLDGGKIFFELTDVGAEGVHFESFLAQPFEDHGGIQTSRVGKKKLGL